MKRKHKPESKRRKSTWPSPELPERYLARLRESGLFVTESEFHYLIVKPQAVPGNSLSDGDLPRPNLDADFPPTDAPYTWLRYDGMWQVSHEGPLRSAPDGARSFGTAAGAVTHLLDFYFGASGRMQEWLNQQALAAQAAAEEAERPPDPKADLCHIKGCVAPNLGHSKFCSRHHPPAWWQRYKL